MFVYVLEFTIQEITVLSGGKHEVSYQSRYR